jgi:hypothetical protein
MLAFTLCAALSAPLSAEEAPRASQPERPAGTVSCSADVQSHVSHMLAHSPTFRAQFQRVVDHSGVIVSATLDPTIAARPFSARSTIRRYDSGLVVVEMALAPGPRVEEYIAHEFEHVLEQLEGLDLATLARRGAPGIWFSTGSLIETDRATRAGRTVMDELRTRWRPDNLVQ